MHTIRRPAWCCLLALALGGCNDDAAQRTRALFDLSAASQDLYAIPYPNDIRLLDNGTIDLAGLDKDQPDLIRLYLQTVAANDPGGFGVGSGVFFRFRDGVDPGGCGPATAADSIKPGSSVFLVNIDKSSPDYNTRVPVTWKYTAEEQKYIGQHSLAVLPVPGFVLAPATTYAAVVTEGLCDLAGDPLRPDVDLELLLDEETPDDPTRARAHAAYAPLRDFVSDQGLTGVVSAAVFTTGQPTSLAGLAREVLYKLPAPEATDLTLAQETDAYYVIEGSYEAPNFQSGAPPYFTPNDGGNIELDASGRPKVAREESLRFALSIPRGGSMPAAGWPVVLYAHGTGGTYRSFIVGGVAQALAEVTDPSGNVVSRLAAVGIDQVLHGPRAPNSAPEVTFFNLQNPAGAVHNVVQGGIDDFSLLRMVNGLTIGTIRWGANSGRQGDKVFSPPLTFDAKRVFFMGHSQGGLTGPVFLAHEPGVTAAVLSGAGGGAVLSMLEKTKPINIAELVHTMLGEPVDAYHPMLSMLQQMLETADTANYARLLRDLPHGIAPKHVFVSQGFVDHYTPNATTDALAVALGAPQVGAAVRPVAGLALVPGLPAAGATLPVAGNVSVAGTAVTRGLLQYPEQLTGTPCSSDSDCEPHYCVAASKRCAEEGHWVVFDREEAIRQYAMFLATAARDGVPSIVK